MTLASLVDVHNHLIPGVDDGARSVEDSLIALREMREQGVRRLIATPHLDAELMTREVDFAERMAAIDAGWERFRAAAAAEVPEVEVARGHEIMLNVPEVCLDEPRVRLAGGACVLLELPRLFVPPSVADSLGRIRAAGFLPLVAHPERYLAVGSDLLARVEAWRGAGARMVVNAGSLLGGFGESPREVAREMLRRGWVDLIGSDFHARPHRPLLLRQAWEQLAEWGGEVQATLLLSVNPGRAMDGAESLPVPPLPLPPERLRQFRKLFSR